MCFTPPPPFFCLIPAKYRPKTSLKVQRDLFFRYAIDKFVPEKPQDYSSFDYLRAVLFALKEAIGYLDTVRTKLKQLS